MKLNPKSETLSDKIGIPMFHRENPKQTQMPKKEVSISGHQDTSGKDTRTSEYQEYAIEELKTRPNLIP